MENQRIGIDFGKVIVAASNDGADTSFFATGDGYLNACPNEGALEVISRLVTCWGSNNLFIVSKCGDRMRGRTLNWLAHNRFYEQTGFDQRQVRFCYQRPEKADICQQLGMTVFIDDSAEVLHHIARTLPAARLLLFQGRARDLRRYPVPSVERVGCWADVERLILVNI